MVTGLPLGGKLGSWGSGWKEIYISMVCPVVPVGQASPISVSEGPVTSVGPWQRVLGSSDGPGQF